MFAHLFFDIAMEIPVYRYIWITRKPVYDQKKAKNNILHTKSRKQYITAVFSTLGV